METQEKYRKKHKENADYDLKLPKPVSNGRRRPDRYNAITE